MVFDTLSTQIQNIITMIIIYIYITISYKNTYHKINAYIFQFNITCINLDMCLPFSKNRMHVIRFIPKTVNFRCHVRSGIVCFYCDLITACCTCVRIALCSTTSSLLYQIVCNGNDNNINDICAICYT